MLPLILAIIAAVLFVLAAANAHPRQAHLGWLGAACLTAAFLVVDTFAVAG